MRPLLKGNFEAIYDDIPEPTLQTAKEIAAKSLGNQTELVKSLLEGEQGATGKLIDHFKTTEGYRQLEKEVGEARARACICFALTQIQIPEIL